MSGDTLPTPYSGWLTEVLGRAAPTENAVDCASCSMCGDGQSRSEEVYSQFRPDTKCCTYWPKIPNFSVGGILSDETLDLRLGRQIIERQIEASDFASPLGLFPSLAWQAQHDRGQEVEFGNSEALRCPYYIVEGGLCGVWKHRNAVCATYFCKFDRGALGHRFWRSLRDWLTAIEQDLSIWCVSEVGLDTAAVSLLLEGAVAGGVPREIRRLDGTAASDLHKRAWGSWLLTKPEFFRQCFRLTQGLRITKVRAICGPRVRALETVLTDNWRALKKRGLPDRLRVGPFAVSGRRAGQRQLVTYLQTDPLGVSDELFEAIQEFDGRLTSVVRRSLEARVGISLTANLLRALCDAELLVDAGEPKSDGATK